MKNSKDKKKHHNLRRLSALLIIGLILITGLFFYLDQPDQVEQIDYSNDYPEVYAGTDTGKIYHLRPGESPERVEDAGKIVHEINFGDERTVVSVGEEGEKNEVLIFGEDSTTLEFAGFVHGAITVNDKLLAANHGIGHHGQGSSEDGDHSEEEQHSHGDNQFGNGIMYDEADSGHILSYDLNTGEVIQKYPLESAYRLRESENGIVGIGAGGEILIINETTLEPVNSLSEGKWIGGAGFDNEDILITSRREVISRSEISNSSGVLVNNGFAVKYDKNGSEISSINFGITSVPHDIEKYKNLTLVSDLAVGGIRFVDMDRETEVDRIEIDEFESKNHIPMEMVIDGDYAYLADSRNGVVYRVNLEQREVIDSIDIPGLTTITKAPERDVEWSQ